MKDRGKSLAVSSTTNTTTTASGTIYKNNRFSSSDSYYQNSSSSDFLPCRKHPSYTSSVGICAYCLKDRLVKLVCSDCGEQRLSSCSCSDISSSYPNSCIVEVGSVGRVSFLIENDHHKDQQDQHQNLMPNLTTVKSSSISSDHTAGTTLNNLNLLKRSSSSSIDVKSCNNRSGFWRFGRFFRKISKRSENFNKGNFVGLSGMSCYDDNKSEIWVSDQILGGGGGVGGGGVSRSKSVCSFRGNTNGFDDHSSEGTVNFAAALSARASDVNRDSAAERKSGGFSNSLKKDGYCSSRISEFSAFEGIKRCDLIDILDGTGDQEDCSAGFIDLKLGCFSSSDSKLQDHQFISSRKSCNSTDQFTDSGVQSGFRLSKESDFSELMMEYSQSFDQLYPRGGGGGGDHDFPGLMHSFGGSCRITVNDHHKEIKNKCKKSSKVWKWILKHHPGSGGGDHHRSSWKKDHDYQEHAFKSSPGRDY